MTDEERTRLVIELTKRSRASLAWLTETEELNKTTVTNRALQIYEYIVRAQVDGKRILIDDADGYTELVWL